MRPSKEQVDIDLAGSPQSLREERLQVEVRALREELDAHIAMRVEQVKENDRLREELAETHSCCGESETGSGHHSDECPFTELAELRAAYDLLHKRIEAYDETHRQLQELKAKLARVEALAAELGGFRGKAILDALRGYE